MAPPVPVQVFSTDPPLSGYVAPGFERVRDQFLLQLREGGKLGYNFQELGSSFAAFHRGKCVVCLWGGYEDRAKTKLYGPDTLSVIFSSGKAVMAIVVAAMISQGRLSWDTKAAELWPEFAAGGKENVTLRDILTHQGGVAWLDKGFNPTIDEAKDLDKLAARIATQPHNHGGKLVKSYHAITQGWYLNELVRRAHPQRKSQGMILKEEINPRLGIEIYVGLPPALHPRVCRMVMDDYQLRPRMDWKRPPGFNPKHFQGSMVMTGITKLKDRVREPAEESNYANSPSLLECETAAGFTVSNAYSIAALASVMSRKGEGWLMSEKTWEEAHRIEERNIDQPDTVSGYPVRNTWAGWAKSDPGIAVPQHLIDLETGSRKPFPPEFHKSGWEAVGWFGNGGSVLQWYPDHEIGVGYVPNLMHAGGGDERSAYLMLRVVEAVEAIEKAEKPKM
ncbi:beta-lactamase/transpeptidase-like protein [Hyaloraphidium curvatum]|nr:beta-lactamase/transpeptidase-like protein [Hyaloraphidium curvatum]